MFHFLTTCRELEVRIRRLYICNLSANEISDGSRLGKNMRRPWGKGEQSFSKVNKYYRNMIQNILVAILLLYENKNMRQSYQIKLYEKIFFVFCTFHFFHSLLIKIKENRNASETPVPLGFLNTRLSGFWTLLIKSVFFFYPQNYKKISLLLRFCTKKHKKHFSRDS